VQWNVELRINVPNTEKTRNTKIKHGSVIGHIDYLSATKVSLKSPSHKRAAAEDVTISHLDDLLKKRNATTNQCAQHSEASLASVVMLNSE